VEDGVDFKKDLEAASGLSKFNLFRAEDEAGDDGGRFHNEGGIGRIFGLGDFLPSPSPGVFVGLGLKCPVYRWPGEGGDPVATRALSIWYYQCTPPAPPDTSVNLLNFGIRYFWADNRTQERPPGGNQGACTL